MHALLRVWFYYGLVLSFYLHSSEAECQLGIFNISMLQSFNPWHSGHNKTLMEFDIYLCGSPNANDGDRCSNKVFVTGDDGKHNIVLGDCGHNNFSTLSTDGELQVVTTGAICQDIPGENMVTVIYFKCGKKMGRPAYLGEFGCSFYFEWESFHFCKDLPTPVNEIPCFIYNNTDLIDLSPLTLLRGAYLVDDNKTELYINVCRDIISETAANSSTSRCPAHSSSCQIINGKGRNMGEAKTKLQVSGSEIKMIYTSVEKPDGCIDNPKTTVLFKCPDRGGSKEPLLLDDFQCDIHIEWFTEYACPQQSLTSENCKLSMETHDIDIDLTPLTRIPGKPYTVNVTSGNDHYIYYLNVCDKLSMQCGNDHHTTEAVCQVKQGSPDPGKVLGHSQHGLLSYSDGELILSYKDGDACHTNFRRNTIINFHCQPDAKDGGKGEPVFREEIDCSYFFDWNTSYACINHPGDGCYLEHDGKHFDLSDLTVEKGNNWLALNGDQDDSNYHYYINVCHDVLKTDATAGCPAGAAVCRHRQDNGNFVSLGSYTSGLKFDSIQQRLYINYTTNQQTGVDCPGVITSLVYFICKKGDLESAPTLVSKSADECSYQFEWYTAAACSQSRQQGSDCAVVDAQSGYSFDLNGLKKAGADAYKVSTDQYDFFINVCDKVGGAHCQTAPHNNSAVCQVKKDGSLEFKTGEPSQTLEYLDGVLRLTYTNGDPYNDGKSTPRTTQISFVCDYGAGAGNPEYLVEKDQMYIFRWMTAFACPARPVECIAEDSDGKQYDLSSLAKSAADDNWVIRDDSDRNLIRKFYINICRPLAPLKGITGPGCDITAAVCQTKFVGEQEMVSIANTGQAKNGPTVKKGMEDYLSLEYTGGDLCTEGGPGARYNTTIHFMCNKGEQSRGPGVPRKLGPCSFDVIWETPSACPLTEISKPDSCVISDGTYNYSLHTLRKGDGDFYTAQNSDKSQTFRLNICGPVASPNCTAIAGRPASVCQVLGSSTPGLTVADFNSMSLHMAEPNMITITYEGQRNEATGRAVEVQIELACNRELDETPSIMNFLGQSDSTYRFRLETPISCSPQKVDCVVQGRQGQQYDLTPLAKVSGNYEVLDSRSSAPDLRYYINVCWPVNEITGSSCPGGPIGGCQTGSHGAFSLGYVQSKPHVADEGTVTLRYVGGTVCHKGTPQETHRSMRINFLCSNLPGSPEFVGESANCEYSFLWKTSFACPQQKEEGDECKVVDPLYDFEFNLNPLRSTGFNYNVTGDSYLFLLNVCGSLINAPAGCADMGACQTGSSLSSPVAAGKGNSKLIYSMGELSLVYDNGKDSCHGRYTRKTIITFVCDHNQPGRGEGPLFLNELEDCTYTFIWKTALACPPHTAVDCTFTDGSTGNRYDLTQLARTDINYKLNYGNISFIINVCHTLIYGKGEVCPYNSAACMINNTETNTTKRFQSLGEVLSNPVSMEDGHLVIRYKNGAVCEDGTHLSTKIILTCPDGSSPGDGGPGMHVVMDRCEHIFTWNTRAACKQSGTSTGSNCTVANPATGYTFDLSSLSVKPDKLVYDMKNHHFFLNVCGPVATTGCVNTSGSCQSELSGSDRRGVNLGNANGRLIYLPGGVLMLNYSGGDLCPSNVPHTSVINFVCHPGAGAGSPVLVDSSDDCLHNFDWHTELACETQVYCQVNAGDETFDLTPLIKDTEQHLAIVDVPAGSTTSSEDQKGRFYINVCRPLNPISNILCPAGSAACRVVEGRPPQSLGVASDPPVYDPLTKEVRLTYTLGQPCPSHPGYNASTLIIFSCKQGTDLGMPHLKYVTVNCQYTFQWDTYLVCPDSGVEKETSNCSYNDSRTAYTYDISALRDVQEVPAPQGGKFFIQACGALSEKLSANCSGAAVCLVGSNGLGSNSLLDGSYGSAATGLFSMEGDRLRLTFSSGQTCQHHTDRKAKTTILFECDTAVGYGKPEASSAGHLYCDLSFIWRTSVICPPLKQDCAVSSGDAAIDLTVLSQNYKSWMLNDTDGTKYWLNLCQGVHGQALEQKCSPGAAVCRQTKDGMVESLGDVKTQKLSVLGDGTVQVEYFRDSSAACPDKSKASTVIRLTCGKTVGKPVLKPSSGNGEKCFFEFTWESRAACKYDSLPQELKDVNLVIEDPGSAGIIDLRPLVKKRYGQAYDGKYVYYINLEGHLGLNHSIPATSACITAAVCQQINATYYKNLGSFASRKYYQTDDGLEVVYTSSNKCSGNYVNKSITSILTFICNPAASPDSDPVFSYQAPDCTYLFNWDHPSACVQAKTHDLTDGADGTNTKKSDMSSGSGINKTTLVAVLSIFSVVLAVCLLAVYFHSPERRAAFTARIKRPFCKKSVENEIRYTVLSQMDEDPEVEDAFGRNPFEEEENELRNGDPFAPRSGKKSGRTRNFHDDSDDDMLL